MCMCVCVTVYRLILVNICISLIKIFKEFTLLSFERKSVCIQLIVDLINYSTISNKNVKVNSTSFVVDNLFRTFHTNNSQSIVLF